MFGIIINLLLFFLIVAIGVYIWYGIHLNKHEPETFDKFKGLIEYVAIGITIFFALLTLKLSIDSIHGSTNQFNNVIQKVNKIVSVIDRKPEIKIDFGIDPNDTTFEITKITLQNDGNLMAKVYRMKIEMPKMFIKMIKPLTKNGFSKMPTYYKDRIIFQRDYYPPKYILPIDSLNRQMIDVTDCDIVFDKHLNLPFRVFVYYNADFEHDGWVDTTLNIYKP